MLLCTNYAQLRALDGALSPSYQEVQPDQKRGGRISMENGGMREIRTSVDQFQNVAQGFLKRTQGKINTSHPY